MKKFKLIFFLFLFSTEIFSQRFGASAFISGMYHDIYSIDNPDYGDYTPHHGFQSGIQKGAGLSIFYLKTGNRNEDNLRLNELSYTYYGATTDSIHVYGIDQSNGSGNSILIHGTQKGNYSFLTLSHTNFLKTKWNDFVYYLIGFDIGIIFNKSIYTFENYDRTIYTIQPSVDGIIREKNHGFELGINAGLSYEFSKCFMYLKTGLAYPYFGFPDYMMGLKVSAQLGILVPLTK